MARSGKRRDRYPDREPGWRDIEEPPARTSDRAFVISEETRQQIAKSLRYIDEARRALESQQNAGNREIIRELRASADRIYDLLNELEEIVPAPRST